MTAIKLGDRYMLLRAKPRDAATVLSDIRAVDLKEWELSAAGGVAVNLVESIRESAESYAIIGTDDGGKAHIVFGVVDGLEPMPHTWMLGTNRGQQDAAWLLGECRQFYREFFQRWPRTVCFSHESNTVHHRWLAWMDYVMVGAQPWGPYGAVFHKFVREES